MNNYINGMDILEKLTKFLRHNKHHLINFSDHLQHVEELHNGDKDEVSKDDILELVDSICKVACKHMHDL